MDTVDLALLSPLLPALLLAAYLSRTYDPQRLSGKMLRAWTMGVLMLCVWNLLVPIRLGLNSLSALTAGLLGLPGLSLLAVCAFL